MILAVLACTPQAVDLLAADPSRDGEWGEQGPLAVVRETRSAPARVEERLQYAWVRPDPLPAEAPVVVFLQGGLVDPQRYEWLGVHLASRGVAVAYPEHWGDLAIFEASNVRFVLDDLDRREGTRPTVAAGHSLGGVIASWALEDDRRLLGAALLASFPAGDGPLDPGPVLSLSGTSDGSALPEDVRAGAARYTDVTLAFVEGMNHYAWTDDVTESDRDKDGPLERDLGEVRQDALRVLDVWLDAVLRGDAEAMERLEEPFPGVVP